jgi:diphosphomevalonate decarboxylase
MGKQQEQKGSPPNLPANPSASMTLKALCTFVQLDCKAAIGHSNSIQWLPSGPQLPSSQEFAHYPALLVPSLKEQEVARMIRHIERVQLLLPPVFEELGLECRTQPLKIQIRTANTFPASSGIASSASSFAAITLATAFAWVKRPDELRRLCLDSGPEAPVRVALGRISRQGSGSSCRSFHGPWVFWEDETPSVLAARGMPEMSHFVLLIKTQSKKVSSSAAHQAILSSPLWQGRVARVQERAERLKLALREGDLRVISQIAWTEAWEMHSLFHTCAQPFSYWEAGTIEALHGLAPFLGEASPPIVTLDAGPNIHVLVPKSDRDVWRKRLKELRVLPTLEELKILEDGQGTGAECVDLQMEGS